MQNAAKLKQQQAMDERRTPLSNASEDLASTCRAELCFSQQALRAARFFFDSNGW